MVQAILIASFALLGSLGGPWLTHSAGLAHQCVRHLSPAPDLLPANAFGSAGTKGLIQVTTH